MSQGFTSYGSDSEIFLISSPAVLQAGILGIRIRSCARPEVCFVTLLAVCVGISVGARRELETVPAKKEE